jgi:RNA polymerase sigma-70 factor (ECF subfamily)
VPEPSQNRQGRVVAGRRRGPLGDETQVIVAAKEGDREALRELYTRYADDVRRHVEAVVHNRCDAEDITHNVFLKLLGIISKYERRNAPFSAWLMRVARNAALDYLRTRRNVRLDDVLEPAADDLVDDIHRSHDVRDALDELPLHQREILMLRHVVGLSPAEIAERMNRTEASIHGLHHRGRAALRATLVHASTEPVTMSKTDERHRERAVA